MCTFHIHSKFNTFASAGCITLGVILLLIAIFSMDWSNAQTTRSARGLWTYSYEDLSFEYSSSDISSAHRMTQVLAFLSVVFGVVALMLCPLHTVQTVLYHTLSRRMHYWICMVAFHTTLGSWITSVLAMLVWGFVEHDMQVYFFGAGFVTCLMAAFLMLLGSMEVYHATMIQHPPPRGATPSVSVTRQSSKPYPAKD